MTFSLIRSKITDSDYLKFEFVIQNYYKIRMLLI